MLFHIFVSIWWCVCVLDFGHFYRCIAVSNFVSVCSSLITYGVKHLFICLFSICGSLVSCLFRSFAIFKLGYLFTYRLVLQQSKFTNLQALGVFWVKTLYASFVNIFSQSVTSCFLTMSFREQNFKLLIKSSLSIISFMDNDAVSEKSLLYPKSCRSFSCVIF